MSSTNERAKYIFFKCLGNRENMEEMGCLKEYEQFEIPRDIEINWKNEFIDEQFAKADTQTAHINNLISSVCAMINNYKDYSDYKKLLSIKSKYLSRSDLFEQVIYFQRTFNVMQSILNSNSDALINTKIEIVNELENMISEAINKENCMPDKVFNKITEKYGLENKPNYSITRLTKIYNDIREMKEMLLDIENH